MSYGVHHVLLDHYIMWVFQMETDMSDWHCPFVLFTLLHNLKQDLEHE